MMKALIKGFFKQQTQYIVVEGVIFLTMYQSIGSGLINALAQKNIMYFFASVFGWFMQLGLLLLLLMFFVFIVYLLKRSWFKLIKSKKGDKNEK